MADQGLLQAAKANMKAAAGSAPSPVQTGPAIVLAPPMRRWPPKLAIVVVLTSGAGGGAYWWLNRPPGLPPGVAVSNGRLEADEIDVDTKFAGRISEILANEGSRACAVTWRVHSYST